MSSCFTPFMRQCLVAAAVGINMCGFGCVFGFPGILLPQLQAPGSTISISDNQASWLASAGSIPMIFGNFLIPAVMSRAGRKAALFLVTLVSMFSWLAIIFAASFEVLLLGLLIQGFAFGMYVPLRSIYIGEVSSPRYRGGFLAASVLAQVFGILFVHLTGSLITYQHTAMFSMCFPLVSLILGVYSLESPSWLATRGKYEKCRKNFIALRGEEEIPELENMIETVQLLQARPSINRNRLRELVAVAKKKEFYKPVFLMFALYLMLSVSGGPVMASYSVTILELLLGPRVNANFWMVALDGQKMVFSCVAIFVINKVKRRKMLFSVGFLCASSQLLMGCYLYAKINGYLLVDSIWIPGILVNLQMIAVAIGMHPLPAVVAGEVFPLQHRGIAGSIGMTALSVSMFVVLNVFPSLISAIGLQGTLVLYSGILVACLGVAWVLLPETSGRTLLQIEEYFRGAPLLDLQNEKEKEPLIQSTPSLYYSIRNGM